MDWKRLHVTNLKGINGGTDHHLLIAKVLQGKNCNSIKYRKGTEQRKTEPEM